MTRAFTDTALLASALEIARSAGEVALDYFRHGEKTTATVDLKEGGSPVTEADRRVDDFLRERLGKLAPDAGWLSEETADNDERLARSRVFVVDPIDGTRAFMAGDPRWGVCVALVEAGQPVMGIVHMPALGATYTAARGLGARRDDVRLRVSARPSLDSAVVAGPIGTLKTVIASGLNLRIEPRIPSLAYRLVRVAEGVLDAGIASTDARDWDIAAADIIVTEAGGQLLDLDGHPPAYNRSTTKHGVLCAAPGHFQVELAQALRQAVAKPRQ